LFHESVFLPPFFLDPWLLLAKARGKLPVAQVRDDADRPMEDPKPEGETHA